MEKRLIEAYESPELSIKRVAGYARVSVEKEASEHSLAQQISYYNDLISHHAGWVYAGVYADEGISGTKDERPEFLRMLSDCKAGKIDMIITKSITRFARNTVTLLNSIRELKALGIDVLFEKEQIHSLSSDGELMLTLLAMYAEEEARSASENKKWQIRRDFEKGRPTYFRIYGYKWKDGRLDVVPDEAIVVRRIFELYLSGYGINRIARILNDDEIPCHGHLWRQDNVLRILNNEKYIGDLLLQKTKKPDFLNKKQIKNIGQWRQYYVKHAHEPIIERELYEAVQNERKARQKKYASATTNETGKRLFSGLISCKDCGNKFICKPNPSSKQKFLIWKCGTLYHTGPKACNSKQIRDSILQEKTREVLGLDTDAVLDRELILEKISSIESVGNVLRFFLTSGKAEVVTWENPSRSKSWTPEMKAKARERAILQYSKKEERHE